MVGLWGVGAVGWRMSGIRRGRRMFNGMKSGKTW